MPVRRGFMIDYWLQYPRVASHAAHLCWIRGDKSSTKTVLPRFSSRLKNFLNRLRPVTVSLTEDPRPGAVPRTAESTVPLCVHSGLKRALCTIA